MPKRDNFDQQEEVPLLRQLREEADLTQEQLASRLGIAASTIRRWEKGTKEPVMTIAQWRKFCQLIGKNFYELPEKLSKEET